MKFFKVLAKIGAFFGRSIRKHPKPWIIAIAVIVLFCLFSPSHYLRGGVDMGRLVFSEDSETITVYGDLYPRMFFFPSVWNQASAHEPKFNQKADRLYRKWLDKHPEYERVSVSSSGGEKEDSLFRNIGRHNRRQEINRIYTLKKKEPN